jgi:hypothetical protein
MARSYGPPPKRQETTRRDPLPLIGGCVVTSVFVIGLDMDPIWATFTGVIAGALTMMAIGLANRPR